MLGISINGEFLDLAPGTATQLERTSPFFNSDDLAEEYSLPFTFPYTPKNARLLGLPNHYYTRRIRQRIEAKMYDNNSFAYIGELIIETADLNVNDIGKSKINGYFTTGVSTFFQQVKNKKLKDLELGGIRAYSWTNNDPDSPFKGFWQHIHETWNGQFEYVFDPIRNEKWSGSTDDDAPDWINKLDNLGKIDYNNNYNTLAPQVSLKYILQQIFVEHGWAFDYSQMTDAQWQTMYLPSFYAVTWQKIIQTAGAPFFAYVPLATITMNLQNHVPPLEYIQNFIIHLRNRYNWGFEFDSGTKVCSMFPLKNLFNGRRKDWTPYMGAEWKSDFSEEEKIYAFKNEIDGADELSSAPDLTKVFFEAPVMEVSDLPAADDTTFNKVTYVWKTNQYYQCRYDDTSNTYSWEIYADNIYDYEPAGSNDTFTTGASTMPVYKSLYRTNGLVDFYGLFPLCKQEGNWQGKAGEFVPWGIRILFHRGLVWEADINNIRGAIQYPYLTSICFTITQEEPDLDWSDVYVHSFDGVDKGLIRYWWRDTLAYLKMPEVTTGVLYLPRKELVDFRWSDVILLKNIPYAVQKMPDVFPYRGMVQVSLRRIG
jgi:hypothetical protein